ncbi:MAG: transglutaminase-like domain-containing protein [Clostridia bacterium]|nr:transglutaminase-like domain-containing protein [Clostridia bacterium]
MQWQQRHDFNKYLEASEYINKDDPKVRIIAQYCYERAVNAVEKQDPEAYFDPELEIARQCFLLVRDEIKHSHDIGSNKVVLKASRVLEEKEGLCFAKANLLCALLRANNIPAGIGYQYLRLDTPDSPLILHGLVFAYLDAAGGWIRMDARGNREDIHAEFSPDPDNEKMAFNTDPGLGEMDIPFIYAAHDKIVIMKYNRHDNLNDLWNDLPDKLSGNE